MGTGRPNADLKKLEDACSHGLSPAQDYFAGISGAHDVKAFLEIGVVEAMGNNRADIEPTLQHDSHLVPGFVHFAAVDAADGEGVEDHGVPVDGDGFRRDTEHGDARAMEEVVE